MKNDDIYGKSPVNRRVSLIGALESASCQNTPTKKVPQNRRVSLAPASGTFIKDKRSSINSEGTPSKLRKMSQFFHVDKISETLLKDPEKEAFIQLYEQHDDLQTEYKRLKSYVEQLKEDYEMSRGFEAMTRYNRLKIMIKRTIMHLKVSNVAGDCSNAIKLKELARKSEERYESLTSDEIDKEKQEIKENIEEFQQRIDILVSAITDLEEHYNDAKNYFIWTRYQMMKAMVKDLIYKPTIVEII